MIGAAERDAMAPGTDAPPRVRRFILAGTRFLSVAAWAMIATLAALQFARIAIPDRWFFLVVVNAYTWWVYLPAYPAAVGAWAGRRWALAALAVTVASIHFAWVLPEYTNGTPLPREAREAPRLRLMTANLFIDNEDVAAIAREIIAVDPDVVLVQEYMPRARAAFEAAGIPERWPYHVGEPGPGPYGTAIFSRHPILAGDTWDAGGVPMTRATIDVGGRTVRIYNIHPVSPSNVHQVGHWNETYEGLLAALRQEDARHLIVAGDFNATRYHRWYRRVASFGLEGAHDGCERGNATSWPNGLRKAPPIRIDHVLAAPAFACVTVREGRGEGSDHKPIIVEYALLDAR